LSRHGEWTAVFRAFFGFRGRFWQAKQAPHSVAALDGLG